MRSRVLQLDSRDNVLVALVDLKQGENVEWMGRTHPLKFNVPAKHKFATTDLPPDAPVVMYGVLVGQAVEPIAAGELLTVSNIRHQAASLHEQSGPFQWTPPDVSRWRDVVFRGYERSDGQVGTRNYWLVVPLVFCENKNIQVLKQAFEEELGFASPQIYRRQVADLAALYREGKTESIASRALIGDEAPSPRGRVWRHTGGFEQSLRADRRLYSPSQRGRSDRSKSGLPACADSDSSRRNT